MSTRNNRLKYDAILFYHCVCYFRDVLIELIFGQTTFYLAVKCTHVLDKIFVELKERPILDIMGFFFHTNIGVNSFINRVVHLTTDYHNDPLLKWETTCNNSIAGYQFCIVFFVCLTFCFVLFLVWCSLLFFVLPV